MARVLQETGGKKLAAALALISSNQLSGLGRPPESVAPRLMQALTSILTQPETITLERDFDGYVAGLTILSFDENGFDISYGLRSSGLILVRENLDGFRSKITDSVAALGALSNNPAPRPSMPFSELLSDFQALNEGPRLSADGAAQVKKILKKMEFVPSSALPEVRDFMKRAVNYFVLSQPLTDPSVVVSRNADGQPLTLADADKNFSLSLTRVPASGSIAVKINTPSAFYDLEVPGDDHQRLALASFILDMEKWQQRKRLIRVLAAASGFLTSMIPLLLDTYFSARPIVGDQSNVFAFIGITLLATSIFAGIGIAGAIILSNKFIGLRTASLVSGYLESRARYDVSAKAAARLAAPERSVGIVQNILLDRAGGLTGPQKSFFIGLSDTAVRTFWSELTATASRLGYSDAEKMFVDIEWFFSLPQPVRIRRTDPIAERVIKAHQAWTLVSEFLDEKVSQNQSAFARHDLEIPRLYADFRQTVRALAESRKASADKTIRIAVAGPGFYQEPVELYLLAVDSIRKAGLNPADYPIEVSVLDKKGASGIFDKFKDNKIFYGPQDIAKLQALLGGGFSLTEYFEETAEGFRIKPAFRAKFTQIDHDLETGNIFTALDLSKPQDFAVLINVADYIQPSSLARIYTNFDKLLAKEGTIYSDSFGRVPPANISGLPEQIRAQIGALSTTAIFHRIDGARFAASQTPAEKPAPVRAVSSETPVPSVKVIILEASPESYTLKRDSLVRKLAEQMKMTPAETRARFLFERSAGDAKSEIARANLDLLVLDGRALVLDASNEVQNAALLGSNLRAFRRQALERRELVLSFLARISEDLEVSDPQVFSQSLSSLRLALALLVDFLPNPAVADFSFSADSRRLTVDTGLPLSEDAVAQALADTFTRQDSGFAKAALSQMTAYVRSGRADVPALLKSVKDRIDDSFTGEAAELAGAKERPLLVTLDALFTGRRSAAERENLVAQYVADKKRSDETFARHGIAPNRNKDIFITGDPELAGDRGLNEVFDVILKDAGAALDSVSAVRSYIESRRTVGAQDVIGVINHEDKAFAQGEDLASLKSYLIEVKMNFVPTKDTLYGIYGKAALVVLRGGDRRRVVLKTISEMLNEAVAQVRAELQSVGSAA